MLNLLTLAFTFNAVFTHAADVNSTMGFLAYFASPNFICPTGWSSTSYGGRLVKGWGGATTYNGVTAGTPLTGDALPTHQHPSWAMTTIFTASKRMVLASDSNPDAIDDNISNTLDQTTSSINAQSGNLPFVNLNLCKFTSGNSFAVPSGIVAFFDLDTATGCPTTNGWGGDFADANGRFLVFATSTTTPGAMSPAAALTTNVQTVGAHTHDIPASTFNVVQRNVAGLSGCCSQYLANYVSTNTWSEGTASSNHLNIPYVQLRACVASGDGSVPSNFYPPQEAILYYNGATCPGTWRESSTQFTNYGQSAVVGRLIWNNVGTLQKTQGGTQLAYATASPASGNGHDSHSHTISASGYSFTANGIAGSWDGSGQAFCKHDGYSFSIPTAVSTSSLVPYKVMRACNPPYWIQSSSPTLQPTKSPSSSPSKSPTMSGPCQLSSPVKFNTWLGSVTTQDPVMYPTSDWELAWILSTAMAHNCTVRPAGTTHSEDGVIKQHDELDVVLVSLADYVPPSDWNNVLSTTTPSVKMSCGKTWMHLMAIARPAGYVLPTQTAGAFFSIGGVVFNPSVHGAAYHEERMNHLLLSARVMLANGTSIVISGNEITTFRGSLGLLGIGTGCEIMVRPDTGFRQSVLSQTFNATGAWNQVAFEAYMHQSYDIANSSEWFFNPYTGEVQTIMIQQVTSDTPPPSTVTQPMYDSLLNQFGSTLPKTGGQENSNNQILVKVLSYVGEVIPLATAELVMDISFQQQVTYVNDAFSRRDGYFVPNDGLIYFDQLHTFVPCVTNCIDDGLMWKTVNASRAFFLDVINNTNSPWFPSLALEWRIITVKAGTLLLEHMSPGSYISLEIVNVQDTTPGLVHLPFFKQLEAVWHAAAGTVPGHVPIHHGKSWGLGSFGSLVDPYPFQDLAPINGQYSSSVKSAFIAKMMQYDPTGLFRGGEGLRMLGLSNVGFEPRGTQGDHCNSGAMCIDGCCTVVTQTCVDAINKLPSGQGCDANCACQSGICFPFVCW